MSKARDLADFISTGSILSDGTIESTEINGVTADASELNVLDGVTVTTEELNVLDGITVTTEELNNVAGISTSVQTQLDGKQDVVAGVSDTEIGYLDGVTSALQTQLDNISVTSGSLTKSFLSGETASITLAQAISPAPVVSATKEVAQAGISSKGTWDVNATASNYELHNTAYATTLTPSTVINLTSASYDSVEFLLTGQDSTSSGLFMKPDGTAMYTVGGANDTIFQYTLSTAFDLSTASYASKSFSVASQDAEAQEVFFKPDGTKMYMIGYASDQVHQYTLSTAWDVSTASYDSISFSVTSEETLPKALFFNPIGTKMYIAGVTNRRVYQYTLSTAWDVSSASYDSKNLVVAVQPTGIGFNSNGTALYIVDQNTDYVNQYNLSTAYDVSTGGSSVASIEVTSQDNSPQGISFSSDFTKMYLIGNQRDKVYQYSAGVPALVLGTGSFASTDVGKRIQGNGGDVTLTSTAGAYDTTGGSAFTDSSTIASGSWSMRGLKSVGDADGIGLSGVSESAGDTTNTADIFGDGSSITLNSLDYTMGHIGSTGIDFQNGSNDYSSTSKFGNNSYEVLVNDPNNYIKKESFSIGSDSSMSMSFWYRPTSNFAGQSIAGLLSIGGGGLAYDEFQWFIQSQELQMYSHPNPNETGILMTDTSKWYHIVVVLDSVSDTVTTYVDKASVLVMSNAGVSFTDTADVSFLLGQEPDAGNPFSNFDPGQSAAGYYDQVRIFNKAISATEVRYCFDEEATNFTLPTSQYHIAATNAGGQIDTSTWLDLNTMVADQAAGSGTVHYAVSTDDRTTWSVIKEGSGVRPIVRDNSGTWQYNTAVGTGGYGLASAYNSKTASVSSPHTNHWDHGFNNDGTKMYTADPDATYGVAEWSLSTAYDVSTLSFTRQVSVSGNVSSPISLFWKPDGTKLYMQDISSPRVYQWTASTPFNSSTLSYTKASPSSTSPASGNGGVLALSSDGTKLYIGDRFAGNIYMFTLSTAWEVDSYTHTSTYNTGLSRVGCIEFSSDGTRLLTSDNNTGTFTLHTLSTAWDISTATVGSSSSFTTTQTGTAINGGRYNSDGTKLIVSSNVNDAVYEYTSTQEAYTTSTTWANSTTNDEFYALQEALGETEFNRMDKTQLDAVTDPNHYTLGDTLDLAIALRMDTASASTPTADGVTINYDAAALNQGAVLGTDYDYDFPDSTTVRVTSNAAQNLKIRVV